jgi:hypothetical protein
MKHATVGYLPFNNGKSRMYIIGKGANAQHVHCMNIDDARAFVNWLYKGAYGSVFFRERVWCAQSQWNACM